MNECKIDRLKVQPLFDLEEFMNLSQETRLDADILEKLAEFWDELERNLEVVQISADTKKWLAIWLTEEMEIAIDNVWKDSPSQGYLLNALAQYCCMTAVQELLPQIVDGGCAPAPKKDDDLRRGLKELGIVTEDGTLNRRYAIVSYYPFKGGCEICALSNECPKGGNQTFGMVLPGHEQD